MTDERIEQGLTSPQKAKRSAFSWLIEPHSSVTETSARRHAQLSTVLSLFLFVSLAAAAWLFARIGSPQRIALTFGPVLLCLFAAYFLSRTKAYPVCSYLIAFPILIVFFVDLYTRSDLTASGLANSLLSVIPAAFIIASSVLNTPSLAVLILLSSLAVVLLPILQTVISFPQSLQNGGASLGAGVLLLAIVAFRNRTEQKRLSDIQNENMKLLEVRSGLEQRLEDQSQILNKADLGAEKTNRQFQAIASLASTIAQMRDLDQILLRITTLLSESLGYYHIGVFLLDEKNQYAVLRSTNSAGGQKMLDRGHRLKIGETGIVGYAASLGKPRIATDVGADVVFFNNPDLPETKSEMALPLLIGDRLIGVLDMQSKETSAFQDSDIVIFQTLANQTAVAIENARLFSETRKALEESQRTFTEFVKGSWVHFLQARKRYGYKLVGQEMTPVSSQPVFPEIEQAFLSGEVIIETKKHSAFAIPLVIMGETIGVLDIRMPSTRKWTDDNVDIVRKITERAALALDNARLVEDAQKRAAAERAISEISSKISSSVNLSNILQTTAEELGRALPGSEIIVQLESPDIKHKKSGA